MLASLTCKPKMSPCAKIMTPLLSLPCTDATQHCTVPSTVSLTHTRPPLTLSPSSHTLSFLSPTLPPLTRREFSEQHGITSLLGEYRARCLFSKVWALRDAATNKVQIMLTDELEKIGIASCLPALSGKSRRGK
jgi:hypothetical protein